MGTCPGEFHHFPNDWVSCSSKLCFGRGGGYLHLGISRFLLDYLFDEKLYGTPSALCELRNFHVVHQQIVLAAHGAVQQFLVLFLFTFLPLASVLIMVLAHLFFISLSWRWMLVLSCRGIEESNSSRNTTPLPLVYGNPCFCFFARPTISPPRKTVFYASPH